MDAITPWTRAMWHKYFIECCKPGTNFHWRIDRAMALEILWRMKDGEKMPFDLMCKEYGDDEDWVEMKVEDLDENGNLDDEYQTFEIWEDL